MIAIAKKKRNYAQVNHTNQVSAFPLPELRNGQGWEYRQCGEQTNTRRKARMTKPELKPGSEPKPKRPDGITFYPSKEIRRQIRELAYLEETSQTALIGEALIDLFTKRDKAKKVSLPK